MGPIQAKTGGGYHLFVVSERVDWAIADRKILADAAAEVEKEKNANNEEDLAKSGSTTASEGETQKRVHVPTELVDKINKQKPGAGGLWG